MSSSFIQMRALTPPLPRSLCSHRLKLQRLPGKTEGFYQDFLHQIIFNRDRRKLEVKKAMSCFPPPPQLPPRPPGQARVPTGDWSL